MGTFFLLQSQKNELLLLIQKAGLSPRLFTWSQAESRHIQNAQVSCLEYVENEFYYIFDMKGEAHYAYFSPAANSCIGSAFPVIWSAQVNCFTTWLNHLIKEENEPNLWENIQPASTRRTYATHRGENSPDYPEMSLRVDALFTPQSTSKKSTDPAEKKCSHLHFIKRYYGRI